MNVNLREAINASYANGELEGVWNDPEQRYVLTIVSIKGSKRVTCEACGSLLSPSKPGWWTVYVCECGGSEFNIECPTDRCWGADDHDYAVPVSGQDRPCPECGSGFHTVCGERVAF